MAPPGSGYGQGSSLRDDPVRRLAISTPPAEEPVTLAEAKSHLEITFTDHDTKITGWIVSARQWAEDFTHRKIVSQTWTLKLDRFPAVEREFNPHAMIRLPFGKCSAVNSVQYTDTDGATQSLVASTDYLTDLTSD